MLHVLTRLVCVRWQAGGPWQQQHGAALRPGVLLGRLPPHDAGRGLCVAGAREGGVLDGHLAGVLQPGVRCCMSCSLQRVTSASLDRCVLDHLCCMPLRCRRALQQLSSTMRPACWKSAACSGTATPSCTPPASASARCALSDLRHAKRSPSHTTVMHAQGTAR